MHIIHSCSEFVFVRECWLLHLFPTPTLRVCTPVTAVFVTEMSVKISDFYCINANIENCFINQMKLPCNCKLDQIFCFWSNLSHTDTRKSTLHVLIPDPLKCPVEVVGNKWIYHISDTLSSLFHFPSFLGQPPSPWMQFAIFERSLGQTRGHWQQRSCEFYYWMRPVQRFSNCFNPAGLGITRLRTHSLVIVLSFGGGVLRGGWECWIFG